ncbi:hypothetical protein CEXT_461461 [Caerostris extrusa]|uniref:Uncharacterized protein n=1 Tax=Caerostris extrusa TaxID=172846 RepID=A0AAV4Q589_CAEEX|nr:hypothetical protein CEXT_461461 [Caerostris extrusa]
MPPSLLRPLPLKNKYVEISVLPKKPSTLHSCWAAILWKEFRPSPSLGEVSSFLLNGKTNYGLMVTILDIMSMSELPFSIYLTIFT